VENIASSTLVTLSTSSTLVASANVRRISLLVQVKSGGVASIKFGGPMSVDQNGVNDGIDVPSFLLLDINCPTANIQMLANLSGTIVLVQEVLSI
jgi:hypothetical protein